MKKLRSVFKGRKTGMGFKEFAEIVIIRKTAHFRNAYYGIISSG